MASFQPPRKSPITIGIEEFPIKPEINKRCYNPIFLETSQSFITLLRISEHKFTSFIWRTVKWDYYFAKKQSHVPRWENLQLTVDFQYQNGR